MPILRAALDPDTVGAGFYGPGNRGGLVGPAVAMPASPAAHDPAIGRRLWEAAERLTGVRFRLETSEQPRPDIAAGPGRAAASSAETAGEGA